eukprot:CAMPEP_0179105690 /NCGR_PEP_ID=MMETSP0796-20121207/49097_1 /TAXON_ID=73915 /ORGANISM="Pyrodinium bahamense, Strain pbaha01" /LENGTH=74 /DNA_ID=CAMNT_0020803683 /DNA_START=385 /DNA_END=609 /DNA_ORIENTATION=-
MMCSLPTFVAGFASLAAFLDVGCALAGCSPKEMSKELAKTRRNVRATDAAMARRGLETSEPELKGLLGSVRLNA